MKELEIRGGETWTRDCTIVIGDHGAMRECSDWRKLSDVEKLQRQMESLNEAALAIAGISNKARDAVVKFGENLRTALSDYDEEVARWRALPWHQRIIESIKWDLEDYRFIARGWLEQHGALVMISSCSIIVVSMILFAWWAI